MSTAPPVTGPGIVVAQDLCVTVDGRPVLRGADLTAAPGDTVAVLGRGADAAAPAMLLRVLCGLRLPDSGWVHWAGHDMLRLRDSARSSLRRRDVGAALDCSGLLTDLPVLENVALPLLLDGLAHRSAVARAADLLDDIGLTGLGAHRVGALPHREQALVVVGRALVTAPRLVVAQDPAGALPPGDVQDVVDVLLAGCARTGASLVLGTADEHLARRCGRIVEITDGHTCAPASHPARA